ncbi:hypothetical protein V8G54_024258 [Vigna mungo]|uniref:Uncharacterized protein n=1 Tax=Vigna mungo TaxID=3915 RepID=A0AAQ3RR55_VIGMU
MAANDETNTKPNQTKNDIPTLRSNGEKNERHWREGESVRKCSQQVFSTEQWRECNNEDGGGRRTKRERSNGDGGGRRREGKSVRNYSQAREHGSMNIIIIIIINILQ